MSQGWTKSREALAPSEPRGLPAVSQRPACAIPRERTQLCVSLKTYCTLGMDLVSTAPLWGGSPRFFVPTDRTSRVEAARGHNSIRLPREN
jgi:hypothetical protein